MTSPLEDPRTTNESSRLLGKKMGWADGVSLGIISRSAIVKSRRVGNVRIMDISVESEHRRPWRQRAVIL